MPSLPLVVIVEDDAIQRAVLLSWLSGDAVRVRAFPDGESFLEEFPGILPDLLILDRSLPGVDGLALMEEAKARLPEVPVIMLTSDDDPDSIIRAMRLGAHEYLVKPTDETRFMTTVRNGLRERALSQRLQELELQVQGEGFPGILGRSAPLASLFGQMRRVAPTGVSVLIRGESGSGKELVARGIHDAGRNRSGPFVAINCAALPDNLLESELFGHERGAFTGADRRRLGRIEQAHGGTLFLDEIGEMPTGLQAKLLRVLQEGVFQRVGGQEELRSEFRLLSATNRELEQEIRAGRFREDLYYRVAAFEIVVPPLRARGEDVTLLATEFARSLGEELKGEPHRLSPDTAAHLQRYPWPGNVRELINVLQRAILMSPELTIRVTALPEHVRNPSSVAGRGPGAAPGFPGRPSVPSGAGMGGEGDPPGNRAATVDPPGAPQGPPGDEVWDALLDGLTLEEVERKAVESAVRRAGGNRSEAARDLGISRTTLYRKLGEE